jgi:hypothetical protein
VLKVLHAETGCQLTAVLPPVPARIWASEFHAGNFITSSRGFPDNIESTLVTTSLIV